MARITKGFTQKGLIPGLGVNKGWNVALSGDLEDSKLDRGHKWGENATIYSWMALTTALRVDSLEDTTKASLPASNKEQIQLIQ